MLENYIQYKLLDAGIGLGIALVLGVVLFGKALARNYKEAQRRKREFYNEARK